MKALPDIHVFEQLGQIHQIFQDALSQVWGSAQLAIEEEGRELRLRLKLDHEDSISPTLEWHALKTWHIQLPCGPQIVKTKMDATWSDAASVLQLDLSQLLVLNQDDANVAPRAIGPAFAPCLGEVHIHCLPFVRINPNMDHAFFGDSANLIAKKVLEMRHTTTDATLMHTSIRAEVRGTSCEIMQFALPSTAVLSEVTACALDVFASRWEALACRDPAIA